jgi:uncharacterized protein (DUF362 family)/Pyruvate/2-oxoacid:ferredoxin oxidoreductase delta subunit
VLLKPNVVTPRGPDRPVCTHPAVVRAMAELAHEAGCTVLVADQPTYAMDRGGDDPLQPTGYREAVKGLPIEVHLLGRDGYAPVSVPSPLRLPTVHVARLAQQVDAVINLPKCKTHVQTTLTLAVKNMFGAIAGRDRMRVHARGTYDDLAAALVDCFASVVPQLNVMDAVVAMEGPGPSRGPAKHVGAIAASPDAVALDLVTEELVGFAGQVGTTRAAAERGLGPGALAEVTIAGGDLGALKTRLAPPPRLFRSLPPFLGRLGERLVYVRPRVDRTACVACGGCAEACPVAAVEVKGHAIIDRDRCIECFCCMEACPADAIGVERSLLSRML